MHVTIFSNIFLQTGIRKGVNTLSTRAKNFEKAASARLLSKMTSAAETKPTLPSSYKLPSVWEPPSEMGGTFGSINRPTAGSRFERELPRGEHPLQLYSLGTPNGQKVTILLEELHDEIGLEYDAWKINIGQQDQFSSGFVKVNPNSKIPALLDYSVDTDSPIRVFETGSILLHLAEKHGKFIPKDPRQKAECLNWLFWNIGTAPVLGGGFGHFYKYAPVHIEYAVNRFSMETKRIVDVLDQHLASNNYVAGDEYSIADMAIFPWVECLETGYKASEFLELDKYKNVSRWRRVIGLRPAVKRGSRVNGFTEGAIEERHSAADFN